MGRSSLQSELAVCCWVPLFALRCEAARRPELANRPIALLSPDTARRLWLVSSPARHAGVQPGMTVSRAIGLCPPLVLLEPDPVHYEERFGALLDALSTVSPIVEPVELGRAFVGADGLQGLYGGPDRQVEAIRLMIVDCRLAIGQLHTQSAIGNRQFALRLGWGRGKFVSWVAATRAQPGGAVIVPLGEEGKFLASQPLAVLPVAPDTYRRLRQLGLRTLGDVARLPEDALAAQFGREGRTLWRLAAGQTVEPVVGLERPEPITAGLTFFAPIADRAMLVRALEQLVERALKHPRRVGWRVKVLRVRAGLEHGASWLVEVVLKDPSAKGPDLVAPVKTRLEQSPPTGAVERLEVELAAFAPGTEELQLFARDANAAARAQRRRALRAAAAEIKTRLKRSMLYHVIEVQPWSRLPERRFALIDYEH